MRTYGKPVDNGHLTDALKTTAKVNHTDLSGSVHEFGVIIWRSNGRHDIHTDTSPVYRDHVLVPFHAFYTDTQRITRFGPDLILPDLV